MARGTFNENAEPREGGGEPVRQAYACRAARCPMPGTIFDGGERGVCAWHFGAENGKAFVHVTQVLADWKPVVDAIKHARRIGNDPATAADPGAQDRALTSIWSELVPFVTGSGWKPRIAPHEGEHLGEWGKRLERFLVARVKGDGADERSSDTATVARMRAALKGGASIGNREWDGP